MRRLLAAGVLTVVLTGCSDPEAAFVPNPPDIDVDTPALREAKAEAVARGISVQHTEV